MNHIHVTLCTLFDYFGVLNVRNTVIKEIKNSDFFYPSNFLELVQYIIFPNSFVCGIKDENKLVAFSSVTVTHGVYEIEDTALTIKEFAERYNTTYNKIYHSLKRDDRCERKYKFIRITANQFAEINNLSL